MTGEVDGHMDSENGLAETTPAELLRAFPELLEQDNMGGYQPVRMYGDSLGMFDIPGFSSMNFDKSTKLLAPFYIDAIKQKSIKLSQAFRQIEEGTPVKRIESIKAAGDEVIFLSNGGPLSDVVYALMLEAEHEKLIADTKFKPIADLYAQESDGRTRMPRMHFGFAYPYRYGEDKRGGDDMSLQIVDLGSDRKDICATGRLLDIKDFKSGDHNTFDIVSAGNTVGVEIDIVHDPNDDEVKYLLEILKSVNVPVENVEEAANMREGIARPGLEYKRLTIPEGITAQYVLDKIIADHSGGQFAQTIERVNAAMAVAPESTTPDYSNIDSDLLTALQPKIDAEFALNPEGKTNQGDLMYINLNGLDDYVGKVRESLFGAGLSDDIKGVDENVRYRILSEINAYLTQRMGAVLGNGNDDENREDYNFDPFAVHVTGRNSLTTLSTKNVLRETHGEQRITFEELVRVANVATDFRDSDIPFDMYHHIRARIEEGGISDSLLQGALDHAFDVAPLVSHISAYAGDNRIGVKVGAKSRKDGRVYPGESVGIYNSAVSVGGRMLWELAKIEAGSQGKSGKMMLQAKTLYYLLNQYGLDEYGAEMNTNDPLRHFLAEYPDIFSSVTIKGMKGTGGSYSVYVINLEEFASLAKDLEGLKG